jgi:periplasmic glucans biosynthesis protein
LRQIDNSLFSNWPRRLIFRIKTLSVLAFLFLQSAFAWSVEGFFFDEKGIRSFEDLVSFAQQTSTRPFVKSQALPKDWSDLSYDEYRKVVFDPNKAIWRSEELPFFLEAFHRGFVHHDQVALHSLNAGENEFIPFRSSLFDYRGEVDGKELQPDFGFAGYRVVGKFPGQSDWQEMLTFLGASYFRARNAQGVYGSSARGLAIDSGLPKTEEFPVFRAHWIVKPKVGDAHIRILALLESPSVTGAYEFRFAPGVERSSLDVRTTLFFRVIPEKVGIAPLTSMWMWGDGLPGPKEDERPEVHDADSLLICSEGPDGKNSWTCRSLMRQNYPSLVRFPQSKLRGFGLIQRDVQEAHFLDNEAKYHLRPSLWVEATSEWGEGDIDLLELPAEHEGIDNIATWWVPRTPIEPGKPLNFAYRVHFDSGDQTKHELAKLVAHRITRPKTSKESIEIGLDFASSSQLKRLQDHSSLQARVSPVRCDVEDTRLERQSDGTVTVVLVVRPNTPDDPIELAVDLVADGETLSETWRYLCPLISPAVALPPWRQKP